MMATGALWITFGSGGGLLSQTSPYEGVVDVLRIVIAALSVLLLTLSLSAYRRTSLRRLLIAATAFGLFAVQIVFEFLDDTLAGPFGPPYNDIISSGITLTILVLFFLAIVKGKETEAASTSPDEAAQPP